MSDLPQETEDLLLAFLEGDLPPQECEAVERMIEADPRIAEYLELQGRIEDSIRRVFTPPAPSEDLLRAIASAEPVDLAPVGEAPSRQARPGRLLLVSLATAASLAVAYFSVKSSFVGPEGTIAYRQRPLVEVYEDCVRDGFEPYWVCDDPMLFAATFERRQGVRLRLAELQEGREMLGLSYLAGLSHESTSMLVEVNGARAVIVVDAVENDWRPETGDFAEAGLSVSRWEKFGLAFYQVSPPGTPLLTDAFELADGESLLRQQPPSDRGPSE